MIFAAKNVSDNDMSPVYEAYYGKPKEFIAIESELNKLIKIIQSNDMDTKIAKSDSVITIERLFKKYFKLKDFYLCIYTGTGLIPYDIHKNAFTFPKAFNIFRPKVSSKRVDSTDMTIGVNIDRVLIQFSGLDAEETLAILLHEIGHGMEASLFRLIANLNPTSLVGALIGELLSDKYAKIRQDFEDKVIDSNPIVKTILVSMSAYMDGVSAAMNLWGMNVKAVIKFLKNTVKRITDTKFGIASFIASSVSGYASEKYADSFATAYGYGPALSRALQKLNMNKGSASIEQVIYDIPVVNWWYDLNKLSVRVIAGLIDVHPSEPSRVMAQLNKLKRDAKDPQLDPRVKKELEKDINDIETFINKYYLEINTDDNKKAIFSHLYNKIAIKVFKGKTDIREILSLIDIEE